MAKKAPRKRMNKRMRRAVRKSLSAMFMATALLIAAIPVQDNVAAESMEPIYTDGAGNSTEPEAEAITYDAGLDDTSLSVKTQTAEADWANAWTIVDAGNESYRLQTIFKVGVAGKYNVITAFNQDYLMPANGILEIPTDVVTEYYQFDENTEAVETLINGSRTTLQETYSAYYPSNIKGEDEDGKPIYVIDISDTTEVTQDVINMALHVHACVHQGMTTSKDGKDVACKAQKVVIPQAGSDNLETYIPYNPNDKTFYSESARQINGIADGAFSNDKEHGGQAYNGLGSDKDSITINTLILPLTLNVIGDYAFAGCSGISTIKIEATNLTSIGNHAFEGCSGMTGITINTLEKVGVEAFKGCASLKTLSFPGTLKSIGAGAFANCRSLTSVDMSPITGDNTIGDFAFYNCAGLSSFTFDDGTTSVGDGAFAVPATEVITGSWKEVAFGSNIVSLGKGVLDGRSNVETVVLPAAYGKQGNVTLDAGFFRQCKNLQWVKMEGAHVSFYENTFVSVTSDDFYVEGPATIDGTDNKNYADPDYYSNPRTSAHNAGITYKFTANGKPYFDIAYNYQKKDKNGEPVYEEKTVEQQKYDEDGNPMYDTDGNPIMETVTVKVPVLVTDYYLINAETGALEKYTPDPNNNEYTEIVIKGDYNGVSVKSIAEGCFDDVKETATKLIVEDNTISGIEDNAFKDFIKLKEVRLGNSVASIGASAFEGCDALEDVYFGMESVTIGNKAFAKNISAVPTGLTFHGKIEQGFAPFDWAMESQNELSSSGLRILYKGLSPSDLATIYDRGSSDDTTTVTPLIFYPIYNYLDADNEEYRQEKALLYGMDWEDYSIIGRYEAGTAGDDTPAGGFADAQDVAYVDAAYHIVIPSGITSIDSPAFYSAQGNNASITTYVGGKITIPSNSREAVMYASMTSEDGSVPGLFSGYYEDYPEGSEEAEEYETEKKGNDRVESITMSAVTSIPDYAFDSCERLKTVDLGAACKEIGIAPFRGCTSLETVIGNDTIISENDIIYTLNEDGTYTLVECLPSRGKNGNQEVSVANDPKLASVSVINESAFVDCKNVVTVNLSGCNQITKIPKDCFKGCTALRTVILPTKVNYIEEGAFKGLTQIHVTIPAKEVYIHRDAFEHGNGENGTKVGEKLSTVVIKSYEDSSAYRYTEDNYIGFEAYNEYEHTVVFLNWDFEELDRTSVQDGQSVRQFAEELSPTRKGYKFTGWKSITADASLDKITADTTFVAQFDKSTSSSGSGNNGSASGNNGSNNSSNNNNGSGNKLYTLTVVNGSGSGSYVKDANVIITANNPATGKKFKEWVVDTNNATLASTRVTATSFKMPEADVKITAVYEDDKSSSGNKNSSTVSGNGSSSSTNRNSSNSTKVVITRPGISDTDLASAKVNGSKDGFIVKISETAEATAAVEAALINKYGSLDNLRYCAMDISLYDSTGTNKITDTTGYTIDITIPLPDSLREYAGNNKTAAVVNSQLESLTPKFTTIDGVPCVTFRATHFSPYTIYVDTQNLTAGGLDSTPKTGDGIHPKWFLSFGLGCLSVILFMKKDKKSPKIKVA